MTVRRRHSEEVRSAQATLVQRARDYARERHRGASGRDGEEPYFDHVAEVAGHVFAAGGSPRVIAAAYLHDVVEHADGTVAEIAALFGADVADLVEHVTNPSIDVRTGERLDWLGQKRAALAGIDDSASEVLWLKAADLCANAGELLRNFSRIGDRVWRQYEGTRSQQLGYYVRLGELLVERLDSRYLRREVSATVKALRSLAEAERIRPAFRSA